MQRNFSTNTRVREKKAMLALLSCRSFSFAVVVNLFSCFISLDVYLMTFLCQITAVSNLFERGTIKIDEGVMSLALELSRLDVIDGGDGHLATVAQHICARATPSSAVPPDSVRKCGLPYVRLDSRLVAQYVGQPACSATALPAPRRLSRVIPPTPSVAAPRANRNWQP
jgi:hypothetical protein